MLYCINADAVNANKNLPLKRFYKMISILFNICKAVEDNIAILHKLKMAGIRCPDKRPTLRGRAHQPKSLKTTLLSA